MDAHGLEANTADKVFESTKHISLVIYTLMQYAGTIILFVHGKKLVSELPNNNNNL